MSKKVLRGRFTIPGEKNYEALTLKLAEKWGADVIRDSDGTELSDQIVDAGYDIYSTICLIRDHNKWIQENLDTRQRTFLSTDPEIACDHNIEINLLKGFYREQFDVDDSEESIKYWQVFDRTTIMIISNEDWIYNPERKSVTITHVKPWHKYTVSFMAFRIWEEISMHNHKTNNWNKEHLMQLDPMYPKVQKYLLDWLKTWCEEHPKITVVRFTSLFYNFVWIWGESERRKNRYTDWASYDFTVSPLALEKFKEKMGYGMTAEDFINQGKLHVTHMPANSRKIDWMNFINEFVVDFARKLIAIVHEYGKKAYVFYDDSWVGMEPYNENFEKIGFDGIIKCVFNGFEARLCSGVRTETHELRLHPYLFPVGVNGQPSFQKGGNPKKEAQKYWQQVRRALLRCPVDRIGLGGYLHLVEDKPDFVDYIADIADEFRSMRELFNTGLPVNLKPRVGILHTWGKLRSWTLSGHFHETFQHDLIHINEALSGLPFEVQFISFEDIKGGALNNLDVIINAGFAYSAWSGGTAWKDEMVIEYLTKWVFDGGCFIGVNEPSAVAGYDTYFRMSHVLGVDEDLGDRVCHGKYSFQTFDILELVPENATVKKKDNIYLTDESTVVLRSEKELPVLTVHPFGKGTGIYLGGFELSFENIRMLQNLILYGAGESLDQEYITDNLFVECAYFPEANTWIVVNNSEKKQEANIKTPLGKIHVLLNGYQCRII
ncbi:MAG: 1,3-beta-galactosyl-N-acetylhexosamine phosphorylase [Lachnospiraceae bacterium]|nr:1,3-beta-galactosyl-N-acetylhexosamine phosphorylase [Lachnospiraceae bacterium]